MDRSCTNTVHTVGLPYINDIKEVSLTEIAKALKLEVSQQHRGSGAVDLLIGIDHPRMHTGETRQEIRFQTMLQEILHWVGSSLEERVRVIKE